MIRAFLFDYGGTLDTAARHWFHVLYEGYRYAGIPLTDAQFRTAYVHAERALAKHPVIQPTDDFRTLLYKKVCIEIEQLMADGIWPLAPGQATEQRAWQIADYCDNYAYTHVQAAIPVLEHLAASYPLVMVSNFYGNLPVVLSRYGIAPYFTTIVESAVVGVRKPDPAIFAIGAERAGVSPSECVVVGDSYSKDIIPAHSLGCQTVWFKGEEWDNAERDETLPTHIITALHQLTQWY